MRYIVVFLFLCVSAAAFAQPAKAPAEAQLVQSFLGRAQPLCLRRPVKTCIDAGWKFATGAPGRGLTVAEVGALQQRLKTWFGWRRDRLTSNERLSIGFGLLLAEGLGPQRLHRAFDYDGDGLVTQTEFLADVTLDNRPLGKVLADPGAVDRAGLARRLKLPAVLVDGLFHQ